MVAERGDGDRSWVMVREEIPGEVGGMLVISMNRDQLEVVRLDGRIDEVLMAAVAEDPEATAGIFSGAS